MQPAGAGEAGTFNNISAVYYPSRKFMAELMASDWMFHAISGKQPGDSQSLVTVPFRAT